MDIAHWIPDQVRDDEGMERRTLMPQPFSPAARPLRRHRRLAQQTDQLRPCLGPYVDPVQTADLNPCGCRDVSALRLGEEPGEEQRFRRFTL
ncbi:hypothetical protein [Rhizobium sp. C4]|uniref:hypothetical protein n=1 Tax=Rhizobium sp. C4 TaxID=1349800 RepID=UPI001E46783E|nr:hypothetical protein [Rhizobium sp. C4]MCD2175618.1 hypothetical protein [Rhizobium sp. C4]